jgi:hypothetical protein
VIEDIERQKMLAIPMCGPRVIFRLESIGVQRLADLRTRDPHDLVTEINLEAGSPIWRPPMATLALSNLIEAAAAESGERASPRADAPSVKAAHAAPCGAGARH